MIELYTWTTPNGEKPIIMLEECGMAYDLHMVDIGAGEQHSDRFKGLNLNEKIPVLVDRSRGGHSETIFESGAIMIYLAELKGQFLPRSSPARSKCLSWTFFQVANTGPMIGQYHHFNDAADETIDYAIKRYRTESVRVLGVLDKHLRTNHWLAGDYSIADMINYSWARAGLRELSGHGAEGYDALAGWVERIGQRPAVRSALEKLQDAKARHG
ncbi:glutathione binding-like protein [Fulvimarina sp. 2208YS6-2-32]|uniref:Glutathione binding-like protein n=1 Tax=Fulvimarina uroteuthidis TaxID=3098149 RepID=A0ABU5HXX3_9HYPH|nr:glutathione binding-like protein [Fulvimarina sp. 2208YS6-2-32]MDY8107987.1 glutathione binding-like protein [Fulvimarina sp. 2208YS6-2-32]